MRHLTLDGKGFFKMMVRAGDAVIPSFFIGGLTSDPDPNPFERVADVTTSYIGNAGFIPGNGPGGLHDTPSFTKAGQFGLSPITTPEPSTRSFLALGGVVLAGFAGFRRIRTASDTSA